MLIPSSSEASESPPVAGSSTQLLDLDADGQLELATLSPFSGGFYERTSDAGWDTFRPFQSLPVVDFSNPNLRFVDLTGDGLADILAKEV